MKRIIIIIVAICALLIVFFLSLPLIKVYTNGEKTSINKKSINFFIRHSISLQNLADSLVQKGIIDDKLAFLSVGKYKGIDTPQIAIGKYRINSNSSYRSLLNGFRLNSKGNGIAEIKIEFKFNNCTRLNDLAQKASRFFNIDSLKLIRMLGDSSTLAKFGFYAEEFPAMFIPITYNLFYDTDEKQFIECMANEYNAFWTPARIVKMKNIGLKSRSEVVTLASIVYAEQSIVSDEWPIIAGLYLNRLNKGIRLQSDPTFKFCWGDQLKGVQRLLNVHRDIDCAYNTYKIDGLPPGPICFPSTKVVDAVLNRSKVDFIFMCAKPDYSHRHNFAVSENEHMKNAKEFQTWLGAELEIKKKNEKKVLF